MVDVVDAQQVGLVDPPVSDVSGLLALCSLTVSGCLSTVQFWLGLGYDSTGVAPIRRLKKNKAPIKEIIVK